MIAAIALTAATLTGPTPGPPLHDALHMALATRWHNAQTWNTNLERAARARVSPFRQPTAARSTTRSSSTLDTIRQCESGGNYTATSPDGTYRGAYQFDRQTWATVGGTGDPAQASPAEQDARAQQLYNQRGAQPWPICGK